MNKTELEQFLSNLSDDVRIYIDKEDGCLAFVEDKKPDQFIDFPLYCSECESTGLIDIEPDDVPHGTEGFWVSKDGARYFMAYCDCDTGFWRQSKS